MRCVLGGFEAAVAPTLKVMTVTKVADLALALTGIALAVHHDRRTAAQPGVEGYRSLTRFRSPGSAQLDGRGKAAATQQLTGITRARQNGASPGPVFGNDL